VDLMQGAGLPSGTLGFEALGLGYGAVVHYLSTCARPWVPSPALQKQQGEMEACYFCVEMGFGVQILRPQAQPCPAPSQPQR
jgi:hypothetical protein